MKKSIMVIGLCIFVFLLSGCELETRKCIKSHNETYVYYNVALKIPMTGIRSVCDEYEEETINNN